MMTNDDFYTPRVQMVEKQLVERGICDPRVLEAMRRVPRHEFVSADLSHLAYRDCPLPIGDNQTISQPYVVALMSQLVHLTGVERVLEVGTGSGYQAAVLCELSAQVYSLERYPRLAERAGHVLAELGYNNVELHVGDGSQGLADMAPFDAIVVTAAAPSLPGPLRSQMSDRGGRMILPVGDDRRQYLEVVTRMGNRWEIEQTIPVRFVPLVGRYGFYPHTAFGESDEYI
ncbi:MAG TPA: protein-L-isoaspartate(D-aspartate) O-methyltransferase [Phototrophicaceae bacterium]|nr:protein-L-isoaspartate(D-aspartate) O-methyltransferase [Phototrophicaceae bacterium]HEX3049880.1 protein-L-isoaspartate(D-aspartate) O-methyltransferase [Aggregatilineaceae bacterium]